MFLSHLEKWNEQLVERPLGVKHHNSTASRMTIKLKQHLSTSASKHLNIITCIKRGFIAVTGILMSNINHKTVIYNTLHSPIKQTGRLYVIRVMLLDCKNQPRLC